MICDISEFNHRPAGPLTGLDGHLMSIVLNNTRRQPGMESGYPFSTRQEMVTTSTCMNYVQRMNPVEGENAKTPCVVFAPLHQSEKLMLWYRKKLGLLVLGFVSLRFQDHRDLLFMVATQDLHGHLEHHACNSVS